jgi:hypothetical protein
VNLVATTFRPGGFPTSGTARPTPPALVERIAALERDLADLRQQQRDEDDARVLRAMTIATRGHVFSVRDLVALARLDPALREALHGLRPKQLGKFLARVVDRNIQGLRVQRVKLDNGSWVWDLHFHEGHGDRV